MGIDGTARRFNRAGLVRRGAAGGAMLLATASAWPTLARAASAAAVPDGDLAYLRLLVGAELLEADFQAEARASGKLDGRTSSVLRRLATDEKAHYEGLANLLLASGQTPTSPDDIDFSYPKGTFASASSIVHEAERLEQLVLGAYLGAVENVQTPQLRLPLAQIGANEAQHAAALAALAGRPMIGPAFAPSLQIGAVSDALDAYES